MARKNAVAEETPEILESPAEEQTELAEVPVMDGGDAPAEEAGATEERVQESPDPDPEEAPKDESPPEGVVLSGPETGWDAAPESEGQVGDNAPDVSLTTAGEADGADNSISPLFLSVDLDHPNAESDAPEIPDIPYGEDDNTLDGEYANPGEPAAEPAAENTARQSNPAADARRAFFGLDFHELDRGLTPEQAQEWNSIYASFRGHNVMTGAIAGVDRLRMRVQDRKTGEMKWQRMFCAIVIPFRVRILIPETELWMPDEERPNYVLRNIPGAVIDFVITGVDREGGYAIGSRKMALPSRRYYFSTQPGMHRPGSRISCSVLVVGPRRCLVSCNGFDISLTQRELSWTAVPDLRDKYHAGDDLSCIVRTYDGEHGKLSISVKETLPNPFDGAAFRHPEGSHRQAMIAGKYAGGIFCNLPDGVTVMCNYSFHYDDSEFRIGDRVILIVQRYDIAKKQIYGKIVAKV